MKNRNENQQHTTLDRYRRQSKKQGRRLSALALVCIICCLVSGLTLAYLVTQTDFIKNTFYPANVNNSIDESFGHDPDTPDGDIVKKDVKITNTGDVDAYVRVKVVISWTQQDKDGNVTEVYKQTPVEGTDYTITYAENTKWVYDDESGYWYYTAAVAPGNATEILIKECKEAEESNKPDGYDLTVEIISQSIQAKPDTAVKQAWKVTVGDDGNLKVGSSYAGGITE